MTAGVIPALERYVKRLCKAVAKIVAGTGLQSLAVVHHGLNGVSGLRTGEFFLIGLASLNYRDGKVVFTEVGVNLEHLLGFRIFLIEFSGWMVNTAG